MQNARPNFTFQADLGVLYLKNKLHLTTHENKFKF